MPDLAWRVVQELGHILNYLSVQEPLSTVFNPISPPVYLNGGPRTFLSWVIENTDAAMTPGAALGWLQDRMPRPIDDLAQWELSEDVPP